MQRIEYPDIFLLPHHLMYCLTNINNYVSNWGKYDNFDRC
jgi:hypothetical protein